MNRELQPCGTNAAYYRHRRYGQVPCAACTRAHSDDTAAWKRGYRHTAAEQRLLEADLRELIAALARLFEEEAA